MPLRREDGRWTKCDDCDRLGFPCDLGCASLPSEVAFLLLHHALGRRSLLALIKDRRAPQKHVWRAQMVLMGAESVGTNAIMRETANPKPTCGYGRSISHPSGSKASCPTRCDLSARQARPARRPDDGRAARRGHVLGAPTRRACAPNGRALRLPRAPPKSQ